MKAIVLSFDKQRGFCQLLYKLYMEMWKDCPLTFRIPWNKENPKYFEDKSNVELIQCDSPIRSTMKALLNGIEDDEWVYWCIDDRYPKQILNSNKLTQLHDFLQTRQSAEFDVVKLYRWKEKLKDTEKYILLDKTYRIQVDKYEWGYYHHQFCKSKYLKEIFLSESLSQNYSIKEFHSALRTKNLLQNTRVLVPDEDDAIKFGEPCCLSQITPEGEGYLLKYNCEIPNYKKAKQDKKFL